MILTGGASVRMGADKAATDWNGRRAVDWVFRLAQQAGAERIVTVGHTDHGLPFVRDARLGGGPVGGVLVGAAALAAFGLRRVLVLAVDAPTIRPVDLEPIIQLEYGVAAYDGLHLPFVADIDALPTATTPDWPLARFLEAADVRRLACPPDVRKRLRGANTPVERDALISDLRADEGAHAPWPLT